MAADRKRRLHLRDDYFKFTCKMMEKKDKLPFVEQCSRGSSGQGGSGANGSGGGSGSGSRGGYRVAIRIVEAAGATRATNRILLCSRVAIATPQQPPVIGND